MDKNDTSLSDFVHLVYDNAYVPAVCVKRFRYTGMDNKNKGTELFCDKDGYLVQMTIDNMVQKFIEGVPFYVFMYNDKDQCVEKVPVSLQVLDKDFKKSQHLSNMYYKYTCNCTFSSLCNDFLKEVGIEHNPYDLVDDIWKSTNYAQVERFLGPVEKLLVSKLEYQFLSLGFEVSPIICWTLLWLFSTTPLHHYNIIINMNGWYSRSISKDLRDMLVAAKVPDPVSWMRFIYSYSLVQPAYEKLCDFCNIRSSSVVKHSKDNNFNLIINSVTNLLKRSVDSFPSIDIW